MIVSQTMTNHDLAVVGWALVTVNEIVMTCMRMTKILITFLGNFSLDFFCLEDFEKE